jgi:cell division septation protein DedD
LKSAASNIDTEPVRWSLSWKPDDCSESFTRESILTIAPPTSGVYGLFNFDCQIFIGESANIQATLLRHESETDFQSGHLRPTGFTFETCAAELRAAKAVELIARFRPVLQTQAVLTEAAAPSNNPIASKTLPDDQVLEAHPDHQEFPVHEGEERPKVQGRSHFNWKRNVSLALLAASGVVIFYLGLFTNNNIQERANGASEKSLPRVAIQQPIASDQAGIASGPKKVPLTVGAGGIANQSTPSKPAKPDVDASALESNKKWSVQIAAVSTKADADSLAQRLKAAGYVSRVVKVEVKGQTYYRVRVGQFGAREEAESTRASLASQDGYTDAFLAGD